MPRPRRVLICGDRDWTDSGPIRRLISRLVPGRDVVIEGEARGADRMARNLAKQAGIQVIPFPADWVAQPKAAGPIRNTQMLKEGRPDVVVAFHASLGVSKGTRHMVLLALRAGVPTRVWNGEEYERGEDLGLL